MNVAWSNPNVIYVASYNLIKSCDSIPVVKQRALLVHSLISACGLKEKLKIITSQPATEEEIRLFHSEEYVKYLRSVGLQDIDEESESFGLEFDCPPLGNTWSIVQELAGASISAACELINGRASIALNWCGGWHHAQRDSASGFCYVNDIVLGIQKLRSKYDKVLYIDLDVHHGDGVENAFQFSPKVMTLSLHQQEPGFFPGTGRVSDVGLGRGKLYTVNVPYKAGINDSQLNLLLRRTLHEISKVFHPDVVVCQCGADSLSKDPLGDANISMEGYLDLVKQVLDIRKPILFLGGGGYNKVNAAKLWTAITCTVLREKLPEEIPEHEFFPLYGPDFSLSINSSLRKSENSEEQLEEVLQEIKDNLQNLKPLSTIEKYT